MVADITAPGGKANALLLQKNNLFLYPSPQA